MNIREEVERLLVQSGSWGLSGPPDYRERMRWHQALRAILDRTRDEGEQKETALHAALASGLQALPDFDPYDDEAWLVDVAAEAIVNAMRGRAPTDREDSADQEKPAWKYSLSLEALLAEAKVAIRTLTDVVESLEAGPTDSETKPETFTGSAIPPGVSGPDSRPIGEMPVEEDDDG